MSQTGVRSTGFPQQASKKRVFIEVPPQDFLDFDPKLGT
jgi:hypothetical protein